MLLLVYRYLQYTTNYTNKKSLYNSAQAIQLKESRKAFLSVPLGADFSLEKKAEKMTYKRQLLVHELKISAKINEIIPNKEK